VKFRLHLAAVAALSLSFGLGVVSHARALEWDEKMPGGLRQALEADLDFVKTIRGSEKTERHGRIYGSVDGGDYLKFFVDRIDTVGYAGDTREGVMAYVQIFDPHTMWVSSNVTKYQTPQTWRVSMLWHESRHSETENGGWGHVICPKTLRDIHGQPLKGRLSGTSLTGKAACDRVADGAYGATATMMGNISRYCENCGEKTKADAEIIFEDGISRLTADALRKELFDDVKR